MPGTGALRRADALPAVKGSTRTSVVVTRPYVCFTRAYMTCISSHHAGLRGTIGDRSLTFPP